SRSLITVARVLDSRHIPAGITVTTRGLEQFFSYTSTDYRGERKHVAELLLANVTSSRELTETTGLSRLFIHHTLKDFESRRWIDDVLWNGGEAYASVFSPVHLKRFVGE
ncbi:MAG TPA: hypothetical protein VEQ36_06255, partial [Thermomicrobiales bacterium]|nr:hypothetical protein [Thermomicrobiales bacterium]